MNGICDECQTMSPVTAIAGIILCRNCIDGAARGFQSDDDFQAWMVEVDKRVMLEAGVLAYDLPTCKKFRDRFNDGLPPKEAAEMALRKAGWPGYDS